MKFTAHSLAACLAVLPVLGFAQATVFSTTFDAAHNALNSSTFNITSQGSTWNVASTKDATGSSLTAGGLKLTIPAASGFVEAQTRFTTSPITLSANGDYVKVVTTFSGTNVMRSGAGGSSQLNIGLFDTSGSNPLTGLNNAGVGVPGINITGAAQTWEGYIAKIAEGSTGASSGVYQRPVQNPGGTTSSSQDLLFPLATGGFSSSVPAVGSSNQAGVWAALSNATTYTLAFTITRASSTSYTIGYDLFSGSGTGGTTLATYSATTSGATYLTGLTFDGLAIGARYTSSATTNDITYSSLSVSTNTISAVPEPSTYAALAGLAALGLVAWRRRAARA